MQKKCKIAIIGFGQRGYGYAQIVKSQECAELAAICESSADRAECFARELGLENVPRYPSVGELLAHGTHGGFQFGRRVCKVLIDSTIFVFVH